MNRIIISPLYLISLFEHDLRANASRLSRGKTGAHFSGPGLKVRDGAIREPILDESATGARLFQRRAVAEGTAKRRRRRDLTV